MQAGSDVVTGTATKSSHILGFMAACGFTGSRVEQSPEGLFCGRPDSREPRTL